MIVFNIFRFRAKSVPAAAGILSFSFFVSSMLGLLRDRLLAARFGIGNDVYFAAFRIPDLVYGILVMGGVGAVFLPLFAEWFQRDKREVWMMVSNLFHILLLCLLALSLLLSIFAPFFISLITPGFSQESRETTVTLARMLFLSPLLLGISALFSGILQYFQKFLLYSLAPIFYNVGIIAGILFLAPSFGIFGAGMGVILGAFLHLGIQLPGVIQSGFRWSPVFRLRDSRILELFRLMFPRTLAAVAYHINVMIMTALASFLFRGSITVLSFANNFHALPISWIGGSFAVAAFPALARAFAQADGERFKKNFSLVFRQIIFFAIPASVLLFLLRGHAARFLKTGEFGWLETRLTAACLGIFAFGIVAQSLAPFLIRTFYSLKDTKTPFLIGLMFIGLNISLAVFFLWLFSFPNFFENFLARVLNLEDITDIKILALPLALILSSFFQIVLLLIALESSVKGILGKELLISLQKIGVASALLGIATYGAFQMLVSLFPWEESWGVFGQAFGAGAAGVAVYGTASFLLGLEEVEPFKNFLRRRFDARNGSRKQYAK